MFEIVVKTRMSALMQNIHTTHLLPWFISMFLNVVNIGNIEKINIQPQWEEILSLAGRSQRGFKEK